MFLFPLGMVNFQWVLTSDRLLATETVLLSNSGHEKLGLRDLRPILCGEIVIQIPRSCFHRHKPPICQFQKRACFNVREELSEDA